MTALYEPASSFVAAAYGAMRGLPEGRVTCPDCNGAGEVTVAGSVQRDSFGVWTRDVAPCSGCGGGGSVDESEAQVARCCDLTVWRDGARCLEHDDICAEHRPARCGACADGGDFDADSYYYARGF